MVIVEEYKQKGTVRPISYMRASLSTGGDQPKYKHNTVYRHSV